MCDENRRIGRAPRVNFMFASTHSWRIVLGVYALGQCLHSCASHVSFRTNPRSRPHANPFGKLQRIRNREPRKPSHSIPPRHQCQAAFGHRLLCSFTIKASPDAAHHHTPPTNHPSYQSSHRKASAQNHLYSSTTPPLFLHGGWLVFGYAFLHFNFVFGHCRCVCVCVCSLEMYVCFSVLQKVAYRIS